MVVSLLLVLNFSIGVSASTNYDSQEADACITISERLSVKGGSETSIPLLETSKDISGITTNDHHIFPAFRGNDYYSEYFTSRGINVDDYTITISGGKGGQHLNSIHGKGGWNPKWKEFIDNNPNATAKEVYQFAGKMMDEFGLSGYEIHPYRKGGK